MINSFVIDSYNNETRQETINSLPEITISSAKYKAFLWQNISMLLLPFSLNVVSECVQQTFEDSDHECTQRN
jgi:hypothetical protein